VALNAGDLGDGGPRG